jgi:hypothetical protein
MSVEFEYRMFELSTGFLQNNRGFRQVFISTYRGSTELTRVKINRDYVIINLVFSKLLLLVTVCCHRESGINNRMQMLSVYTHY